MSETPVKVSSPAFLKRKVAGIPVLYLVVGFVVILAVVAWQMKPSAEPVSDEDAPLESADDTIISGSGTGTYPALPLGTVVATPTGPTTDNSGNTSITTNDEWLRRGVMFLAGKGISPGDAQLALTMYLEGNELSFEQGKMRDDTVRELGVPPYPVLIGGTKPDIGRTQGPLPRNHTVKNVNENTAAKLAQLYYGRSDAFAVKAISDANSSRTSYNVGDSIAVPVLPTPAVVPPKPAVPAKPAPAKPAPAKRYHTVRRGDTLSGIAKRYYGNASLWPRIYNANKSKIRNPNLIYPGQVFLIP